MSQLRRDLVLTLYAEYQVSKRTLFTYSHDSRIIWWRWWFVLLRLLCRLLHLEILHIAATEDDILVGIIALWNLILWPLSSSLGTKRCYILQRDCRSLRANINERANIAVRQTVSYSNSLAIEPFRTEYRSWKPRRCELCKTMSVTLQNMVGMSPQPCHVVASLRTHPMNSDIVSDACYSAHSCAY